MRFEGMWAALETRVSIPTSYVCDFWAVRKFVAPFLIVVLVRRAGASGKFQHSLRRG